MDFKRSLGREDSIASVESVSSIPPTLSIGEPTQNGKSVSFLVSGGNNGESFNISVVITTQKGDTIEGDGVLVVSEG
jgi:hypothetical protein